MHPILEIAIGVALGMTVFIVIVWVIGMCVYVACSKNDCIASCKKVKKFKSVDQKIYVPELHPETAPMEIAEPPSMEKNEENEGIKNE